MVSRNNDNFQLCLLYFTFIERYEERKKDIKGEYLCGLEDVQQLEKEQMWLVEKGKKGINTDAILQKQLEDTERKLTLAKNEP